MRRISIITSATAIVAVSSSVGVVARTTRLHSNEHQQEEHNQEVQRELGGDKWHGGWGSSGWWGGSSSSSGKSGKSGSGSSSSSGSGDSWSDGGGGGWGSSSSSSGKSGKSGSKSSSSSGSADWSDGGWGSGGGWGSSSSSGKSGKSGSKSSSGSADWSDGGWGSGGGWGSSSSGKSGKSGSGSSGKSGKSGSSSGSSGDWHGGWDVSSSGKSGKSGSGSSGKSGKSGSSSGSSGDDWHGGWGKPGWWGPSSSSSSKSGKSKSSKSKSSKGSSSSSNDWSHGGHWHGDWGSEGHWHWRGSSSSSKSGKAKSGKAKSSKTSSSSSHDGWFYHKHEKSESTSSLDSSAPGICAPSFDNGGLECDEDDFDYCSDPGSKAECGSGMTCYDKTLCPKFAGDQIPEGVCDTHGKGLECDDVTTYCTEPGDHGECGSGRKCYDAGLCGYGGGDYDGVCGEAIFGGKHSALDCDKVTTKCTEPGEYAECAWGGKCYDASLCTGGKGFCSSDKDYDCDNIKTYCSEPGESGQCPHGQKCYDIDVCSAKEEVYEEPEKEVSLNTVCFEKGEVVECSGDDAYGDAVTVPFVYTVSTDGTKPETILKEMENAILDDVADNIDDDFTGKISAKPDDEISDDEWCGDGNAVRCAVVNGKMTFSPGKWGDDGYGDDDGWGDDGYGSAWDGDGHASAIDECASASLIKDSMDGHDYSDIGGIENAEFRRSDLDCGMIVAGANMAVEEEDELSAGAAFGIFFACLALLALMFLLVRKLRRKRPRDEISLISNNLDGSLAGYDNPYGNTIDVHKCTSIYCNCNSNLNETTFLPAPKKVNMAKTMEKNGISPTAVDDAEESEFFNPTKEEPKETLAFDESKGSIMRVPIRTQLDAEDRTLEPVNEVSESELESVAGDNTDESTVPPPPPLASHPTYGKQGSRTQSNDEISI